MGSHEHRQTTSDAYLGIAFQLLPSSDPACDGLPKGHQILKWGRVMSDGASKISTAHNQLEIDLSDQSEAIKLVVERLCKAVATLSEEKSVVFQIVAISEPLPDFLRTTDFLPAIWTHLNAIPFLLDPPTLIFKDLPAANPEYLAQAAVNSAIEHLQPQIHSAVKVRTDPSTARVLVDANGLIQIASINSYRESTSPVLWARFNALVKHVKGLDIKVASFSATPQGGGVALMRHAMIRLFKLVGVDMEWLVPEGHPAIFDLTKRRFHNVLQGVSLPDERLSDQDRVYFEDWTKVNYKTFWSNGITDGRQIIIDDPQLVGLIPLIKAKHPEARIFFRSHIEIRSDLVEKAGTPQNTTFSYLLDFIKQTDVFLAHPVRAFVPEMVRGKLPVLFMPPSTDPIDGLCKPLGKQAVNALRLAFNDLSESQCGIRVDWDRGYLLQVARFDPSKGLDILLKSYLEFRMALEKDGEKGTLEKPIPQLLIVGHGSVDDPDGTSMYEMLIKTLQSDEYAIARSDVSVVRAPPSDTLLGMLMQGALCALQLSTREGFEVKVSEAVLKRVPIIVSKAGGLSLQVKEGINGWLVNSGESKPVSDILVRFWKGELKLNRGSGRPELREIMNGDGKKLSEKELDPNTTADIYTEDLQARYPLVHPDSSSPPEDYFTVGNAARWLLLFSIMDGRGIQEGKHTKDEIWLLESMGLSTKDGKSGKEAFGKYEGKDVWQMVMADDLLEGEGNVL